MIRLEKVFSWYNCISYDEGHVINEYIMTLNMYEGVIDPDQQNTAYNRMKWWITNVLTNSIVLNESDPLLDTYRATRQRVLAVPSDPVDHLMTMLLYLKLNAIMQDRLIIDEIKLCSEQGDHMSYLHSSHIDQVLFDTQGWWTDSEPTWENITPTNDAVVALPNKIKWRDLDLGWEDDPVESSVVYVDFGKNANK